MNNHFHLFIDYDEGVPDSYRGVVLSRGGVEVKRWHSDPQSDWAAYIAHAKAEGIRVLEASSITHFLWDIPGWRMILNEDGREILVPEDRPEIIALEGGRSRSAAI